MRNETALLYKLRTYIKEGTVIDIEKAARKLLEVEEQSKAYIYMLEDNV